MTIKQLTEIVDGSLKPSTQKLDADLLEVSAVAGNALKVLEDGLTVDVSQLATKAEVATAIEEAQLGGGDVDLSEYAKKVDLDVKVDKVEGKVLTSNDFTNAYKGSLDNLDTIIGTKVATELETLPKAKTYDIVNEPGSSLILTKESTEDSVSFKIYSPSLNDLVQKEDPSLFNQTLANSVPLYTLDPYGKYVLTNPDQWLSFENSNFLIPAYHISTVSNDYVKGIVELHVYDFGETLFVTVTHNVTAPITNYSFECNPTYFKCSNLKFPLTFESSPNGSFITKTMNIPKSTMSDFEDITLATALQNPDFRFTFRFLDADNKQSAPAHKIGFDEQAGA